MAERDKSEEKEAKKARIAAERKKMDAKKALRLDLRKKGVAAYGNGAIIALSITTLAFGVMAMLCYSSSGSFSAIASSSYNKAYYQLIMDANELENSLVKAQAASGSYKGQLLFEASANAQSLSNNLAVIPSEKEEDKQGVFKFCNQAMDYTKYLAKKAYDGKTLNSDEKEDLKKITETATALKNALNASYDNYGSNERLFSPMVLSSDFLNPVDVTYDDLNESSIEYPTLIYDGPFSDIKELSEEELKNKKTLTKEQAAERVRELFGNSEVNSLYDDEQSDLAYSFAIEGGNTIVQIAKESGDPILYSKYREVGETTLSHDDGINCGLCFLEGLGFTDLTAVWKSETDGVLTVNFAQLQGKAVCFSRLAKVVVALDDGEVLGYEGTTYVARRNAEVDTTTKITISEARKKLSSELTVISSRPAVIPKNQSEIMTYEFFAELNGSEFYVYIDAKTGSEVEVLRVVESKGQGQNVV